jgi:hypothetical protein
MIVVCPQCGTKQPYKKSNSQERQRKLCCNPQCLNKTKKGPFKFEVKVTRTEDFIEKKTNRNVDLTLFGGKYSHLTELDRRIIQMIIKNPFTSQKEMCEKASDKTQYEQYFISRKLKRLIQLGIIGIKSAYPKNYEITDPKLASSLSSKDELLRGVISHSIKFRIDILETSPQLMLMGEKGWLKKYFHVEGVEIANNNDNSLEFNLPGAGLTEAEALNNAKLKSIEIQKALETKFCCRLAVPTAYCETHPETMKPHNISIKTTQTYLDKLKQRYFFDGSHDEILESAMRGAMDELNTVIPEFKQLKPELIQIKQDVAEVKQRDQHTSELLQTAMTQSLTQFENRITHLEASNENFKKELLNEFANVMGAFSTKMGDILEKRFASFAVSKPEAETAPPKDAPNEMYK